MTFDVRAVPAAEQIRQYVVMRLQELNNIFTDMLYYKDMNKSHGPKVAAFRSGLISFYIFLRPKIMGYVLNIERNKANDEFARAIAEDYKVLMTEMDKYTVAPSTFDVPTMVEVYKYMLQFTEDYQLTTTTVQREGI